MVESHALIPLISYTLKKFDIKNKLDYNTSAFSLCVYDNNKITLYCFITEVERKVRHNLLGGYHGLVQPKGDGLLSGRQEFRISQIPTKEGHIYTFTEPSLVLRELGCTM